MGSETGTVHGKDGLHSFGSEERDETGRWFPGEQNYEGLICPGLEAGYSYIRNAGHARAFELVLVQLFHGGLEVVCSFEFNKPCVPLSMRGPR